MAVVYKAKLLHYDSGHYEMGHLKIKTFDTLI